jgi:hypothetical protein
LDDLRGGQKKKDFQDFVKRYDQGHPAEGYSDEEVLDRYRDVAHAVPADQYAQAAQEALARLSPEERAAFVRMLQERAQTQNVRLPERMESNPQDLGSVLTDLHQTPGRLRDLLGGGAPAPGPSARVPGQGAGAPAEGGLGSLGSLLGSPLAKAALAGIAAMVARRVMRG